MREMGRGKKALQQFRRRRRRSGGRQGRRRDCGGGDGGIILAPLVCVSWCVLVRVCMWLWGWMDCCK